MKFGRARLLGTSKRNAPPHAILGALVLATAPVACLDSSGSHDGPPYFAAQPFVRARWIATHEGRGSMVDDLIARHLLVGTSRADVAALLGIEIANDAGHAAVDVGATPMGFGGHLEIDFDTEGRLLRAYVQGY